MNEACLCRLLGYLFGDASFKTKRTSNAKKLQTEVAIECADRAMVEDFSETCKTLLKREVGAIHSRKRSKNWRRSYTFNCKINKGWRDILTGFSPTFRTKPFFEKGELRYYKVKIPDFVYRNPSNIRHFLKAFTNSEGSIQLRVAKRDKWFELTRYVKISCSQPFVLKHVSRMLRSLGISNRMATRNNPVSVIIQREESVIKFRHLIGFMKGIQVSNNGRWAGYEKSNILDALVRTYEIPRGKLTEFKEKQEIYDFIKINYLPKMDSETRIQALRGAAGAKISQCTKV